MHVAQSVEVQHELLDRLTQARRQTDELFQIVKPEALYDRPIPERHRVVFYVGHLEAFDWNLLHERVLGLKSTHPEFDRLFAFGIDPVGGGLPNDRPADWPSPVAVEGYVQRVRRELDDGLQNVFSSMPPDSSASLLLNVAIEHRLMHAETLAYMLHQLPFARKIKQSPNPELVTPPPKPKMIEIPAGTATLGLARDGGVFGWDNEFERVEVSVPAFAIDQFMVTNAQFLEFMSAGGYQNPALWSPADWGWRSERRVCHPVFWRQSEEGWLQRTMFEEIPLPPHWPVYVSHAEASAYARWTGKSLPSEEQWDRAAFATREGFENRYPWGNEAPDESRGNFDFHSWDPVSVAAHSPGESALGVAGLLGNGWEWTSTVFGPLPGFEPFPFYRGYSADFFDGKHYAMKGGSMRTAASMLRRSFRNWFQAHYQYVYAGFRCVSN